MIVTDEILNEWSFRCHDGIVDLNDPKKLRILKEILEEEGINLDEARPKKIKEPELEPEKDTIDYYLWVLKNKANIKDENALEEIRIIYSKHPFDSSEFRVFNINQLDEIYNVFKEYITVGSTKRGVGKGEYAVLLGLANSKSGGTAEKDIIVGNNEVYEVKELAGKEFRTGSSGYITNTNFQRNFNYLMSLLIKLSDNNTENKSEVETQIDDLINYFKQTYKKGNISEGIFKSLYTLLPKLKTYNFGGNEYNDSTYVKIGGKKYKISSEETDTEGNPISIKLGGEVSEQNSLVIKLKNHPWVKDSNQLDIEFKDIWLSYLKDITGFIVYTGNKLTLYSPETIKQNFEPVRVVQNQLNIVKKGEI